MTSSFMLQERIKEKDRWTFQLPDNPTMSGQDDHYLRPFGRCHPDFKEIPIGNPYGVKVCLRRTQQNGERIGDYKVPGDQNNGYYRGSVNLYNPRQQYPTQKWNPYNYSDRRIPWEQDLIREDYLRLPIKYNGTGLKLLNQPDECSVPQNGKQYTPSSGRLPHRGGFYEYGYSYTPKEDKLTGLRTASRPDQSIPERKYDITRPYPQPFELWKKEQEAVGRSPRELQKLDQTYTKRII